MAVWMNPSRTHLRRRRWLCRLERFVVSLLHDPADSTSLDQKSVSSLFQDTTGRLWAGTDDGLNSWPQIRER